MTSKAEPTLSADETLSGPNTRSRKRRSSEISPSVPELPGATAASSLAALPGPDSELNIPPVASLPKKHKKSTRPVLRKPASLKKPPPLKSDPNEEVESGTENGAVAHNCCICMTDVAKPDVTSINGCEHKFCFECIEQWSKRENTCPLCKVRFSEIRRVHSKKGGRNVKKVKQRDQRSDIIPSAALEGLLASFASRSFPSHSIARLIFSGVGSSFLEIRGNQPINIRNHSVGRAGASPMDSGSDESSFGGLFRAMHGHGLVVGGSGFHLMRSVVPYRTASSPVVGHSYASNIDDATAGNRPENPLEIDDSEDDEIEVVQVRRSS